MLPDSLKENLSGGLLDTVHYDTKITTHICGETILESRLQPKSLNHCLALPKICLTKIKRSPSEDNICIKDIEC